MTVREFMALMSKPEHAHLLDCEMEFEEFHGIGGEVSPICHVSVAEVEDTVDDYSDTIITLSNVYFPDGTEEVNHMTTKRTSLTPKPKED